MRTVHQRHLNRDDPVLDSGQHGRDAPVERLVVHADDDGETGRELRGVRVRDRRVDAERSQVGDARNHVAFVNRRAFLRDDQVSTPSRSAFGLARSSVRRAWASAPVSCAICRLSPSTSVLFETCAASRDCSSCFSSISACVTASSDFLNSSVDSSPSATMRDRAPAADGTTAAAGA